MASSPQSQPIPPWGMSSSVHLPQISSPRPPVCTAPRPLRMSLVPGALVTGPWLPSLVLLSLVLWATGAWWSRGVIARSFQRDRCQSMIHPQATLSRATLGQLLTIPERSPRHQIRAILPQPYCLLAELSLRAGVTAEREAYPLAFDPKTWVILLYEGDEYAGYAFQFEQ